MGLFSKIWRFFFPKKTTITTSISSGPSFGGSDDTIGDILCLCYTIVHPNGIGGPSFEVLYDDCGGRARILTINPGETKQFCARKGTIKTLAIIMEPPTKCSDQCGKVKLGTTDIGTTDIVAN